MERLTSREPRIGGMPGVCCTHFEGGDCQAIQGHYADGCACEDAAWERLATYEDTGLEPEEIKVLVPLAQERTYIVTEMCPHCESEVEMRWDTDKLGFKAFCPVCGERLMLCDECRHTEEPSPCDYGVTGDGCWRNPPKSTLIDIPLTLEELREMDGEPVWVCEPNGTNGVWGLVDLEYQMVRLHGGGLAIWENNDKSWLAYRRKPGEESG